MSEVLRLKRRTLLSRLDTVKHLDGSIVEMGVFLGKTLRALAEHCPEKQCYGFDTFEGMPVESWKATDGHKPGDFNEADYEKVAQLMPENVTLCRGIFPESAKGIDPRVCFAHADFDLEKSMVDAIAWLMPRMVPGGMIVFDDWNKKTMPGVDNAIKAAGLKVTQAGKHQAYWTNDV